MPKGTQSAVVVRQQGVGASLLWLMVAVLAWFLIGSSVAQNAESERVLREQSTMEARAFAEEGDLFMRDGQPSDAMGRYRSALEVLPNVPITQDLRNQIVTRFVRASLDYTDELIKRAEYPKARSVVAEVLKEDIAPNHHRAKELELALNDPEQVNLADSPEHQKRSADVLRLLKLAESSELLDDYDGAVKFFDNVLRLDPYNKAAQKGIERIQRKKIDYYGVATTRTRAEMLAEVAKNWEKPRIEVTAKDALPTGEAFSDEEVFSRDALGATRRMLEGMTLDTVQFDDVTLNEALRYLTIKSRELDPKGEGFNFVVRGGSGVGLEVEDVGQRQIRLELRNAPMSEVLGYVARLSGLQYRIEQYAIVFAPSGLSSDLMVTRSYRVPPDFIATAPIASGGASDDPFANAAGFSDGLSVKRRTAEGFLQQSGIPFEDEANANFDPATSTLVMKNTAAAHAQIQALIEMSRPEGAMQVEIRVKMLEVNQSHLYELGFDWLLGAAAVGDGVLVSGGTGDGLRTAGNFPITDPSSGTGLGSNPVTESLRSGQLGLTNANLSTLLAAGSPASLGGGKARAPGFFGVTGVLTEPQFQMIVRGLNQKTGKDALISPTVVTRSGQIAKIEAVREFIYPTEYDPPELPNNVGNVDALGGFPVTPAFPTSFETELLGTVLEVDPIVSQDGTLIELNIDATFKELIGFVNYGVLILSGPLENPNGGTNDSVVLTDNQILQPVFETRREKTSVSVYDGQSLVIGGLVEGVRETVQDSVPILGDIPIIGRLFRMESEKYERKAVLLFVEVNVLDPSGAKLRDVKEANNANFNVSDDSSFDER